MFLRQFLEKLAASSANKEPYVKQPGPGAIGAAARLAKIREKNQSIPVIEQGESRQVRRRRALKEAKRNASHTRRSEMLLRSAAFAQAKNAKLAKIREEASRS